MYVDMDMGLSTYLLGTAGVVAGLAIFCNLPTRLWLPAKRANLQYLAETTLKTLDGSQKSFLAADLWKTRGAVIMAVRRPG